MKTSSNASVHLIVFNTGAAKYVLFVEFMYKCCTLATPGREGGGGVKKASDPPPHPEKNASCLTSPDQTFCISGDTLLLFRMSVSFDISAYRLRIFSFSSEGRKFSFRFLFFANKLLSAFWQENVCTSNYLSLSP